jgi:hypothetical protein
LRLVLIVILVVPFLFLVLFSFSFLLTLTCSLSHFPVLFAQYSFGFADMWGVFVWFGIFVGMGVSLCILEVVHSSVVSFFVCYAEDPSVLSSSKPEVASRLVPLLNDRSHYLRGLNNQQQQPNQF